MRTIEIMADGNGLMVLRFMEHNKAGQQKECYRCHVLVHDTDTIDIAKAWIDGITPWQAMAHRDPRDAVVCHPPEEKP